VSSEHNFANELRLGCFEDLVQYCALGFCRNERHHHKLYSTEVEGLFSWTNDVVCRIIHINFPGAITLEDKQLHMLGYLFEIFYDIALSSLHNVSASQGFETPLGSWIHEE